MTRLFRIFLLLLLTAASAAWGMPSFNKLDSVKAELIAESEGAAPGSTLQVGILLKHKPEWHTYWKTTGDTGYPTAAEWTLPEGWVAGEILWPAPKVFKIGDFINYGYEGDVLLPVRISVPTNVETGSTYPIKTTVSWLMCQDQCVPGSAQLTLDIPVVAAPAATAHSDLFTQNEAKLPTPLAGVSARTDSASKLIELSIPVEDRNRLKHLDDAYVFIEGIETIHYDVPQNIHRSEDGFKVYLRANTLKAGDTLSGVISAEDRNGLWARSFTAEAAPATITPPQKKSGNTWEIAFFSALMAFVGGMILNLMPCVFPVLSLKILGLVRAKEENHASMASHGLAFTVGVLITMTVLACALILVKSTGSAVGWGFQLQSPWFVFALALLFTAITVNLFGFFEFTAGANAQLGMKGGRFNGMSVANSFATGILTVIVASPCTAPFMGAALGYALSASNAEALLIFLALGTGLSLPWLVLTLFPVLTAWLPKPGMWMVRMRTVMGIPMALTVFWLLWVLQQQVSSVVFIGVLTTCITLAAALFALGKVQFGFDRFKIPMIAAAAAASLGYCSLSYVAASDSEVRSEAGTWSPAAVEQHLAQGRPVFVDFTASWCVTCQANKIAVLDRSEVRSAMQRKNVEFLIADWTNRNEEITRALESFGRSGVPLYVLYSPDGKVKILPELLTQTIVIEALDELE